MPDAFDEQITDLGRNAVAGLTVVERGGRLTVEEVFLVQMARAALTFLANTYHQPVDKNGPRPVILDPQQLLKDTVNGATNGDANAGT